MEKDLDPKKTFLERLELDLRLNTSAEFKESVQTMRRETVSGWF